MIRSENEYVKDWNLGNNCSSHLMPYLIKKPNGFYIKISNGLYTYGQMNLGRGKILTLYLLVCCLHVTSIEHKILF